jgi:hypothetical protein
MLLQSLIRFADKNINKYILMINFFILNGTDSVAFSMHGDIDNG